MGEGPGVPGEGWLGVTVSDTLSYHSGIDSRRSTRLEGTFEMFAVALDLGAAGLPKPERLRLAIEEFYARSTRRGHPKGEWRDGLWYPAAGERQACCEGILPSIANRQALEGHCRTQAHVAALYGVPVGELKAAVREDRKQGSPIAQRVASSFLSPQLRGRGTETFSELRRRAREETFEKLHAELAHGLPLFERLHALQGTERPNEELMAPLLETASASAERLVASLHFVRSLEAILGCANALLETLTTTLEQPKRKGRRAHSGRAEATTEPPPMRPGAGPAV